ncbi:hypothetical protein, partial [Geobacillus zalihae]|uniref:hypothetical protein n=1 Tax=Geobacillus zalihae TaxID=213419 RepID=UPI000A9BF499
GEYVSRIEKNEEMQKKMFETLLEDMVETVASEAGKSLEMVGALENVVQEIKKRVEAQNRS